MADKTTAPWVAVTPDLRNTEVNCAPVLAQQGDGLLVDDLPVLAQHELACGIVVLETAGGAVLMSLVEFHQQLGDL
jgi:hypothetical protein